MIDSETDWETVPDWLIGSPRGSSFLTAPDCPCCVEPEPVDEVVRWAIPGV